MKSSYDRTVTMHCPKCNGMDFQHDDVSSDVRCLNCGYETTKSQLQQENEAEINKEVEKLKSEVFKDVEKDFQKIFKNLR